MSEHDSLKSLKELLETNALYHKKNKNLTVFELNTFQSLINKQRASVCLFAANVMPKIKKPKPSLLCNIFKDLDLNKVANRKSISLLAANTILKAKIDNPALITKALNELEFSEIEQLLADKTLPRKLPPKTIKTINNLLIKKRLLEHCLNDPDLFRKPGNKRKVDHLNKILSTTLFTKTGDYETIFKSNDTSVITSFVKKQFIGKFQFDKNFAKSNSKLVITPDNFRNKAKSLSEVDKINFNNLADIVIAVLNKSLTSTNASGTVWEPQAFYTSALRSIVGEFLPHLNINMLDGIAAKADSNERAKAFMTGYRNALQTYKNG